jgi:predicted phosphoadenosine phosphosulfate sulfurtransferase
MEEEPVKLEENWRNPDGTYKVGHPSNGGRPKGQTLKEYQAQKFREMEAEEKEIYLKEVQKELRWRMAEGNPAQDSNVNVDGALTITFDNAFTSPPEEDSSK